MADVDTSILIDWRVGKDFCKTHQEDCDLTRTVLREINEFGVDVHIRGLCWGKVTKAVSNHQHLLEHLRDKASSYLDEYSDDEEALNAYTSDQLVESQLTGELNFNPAELPNLDELRSDVSDLGLNPFRAYVDNHLSLSVSAQRELSLIIYDKCDPAGSTPFMFDATMANIVSDDAKVELLVDAYKWGRHYGDHLLTRKQSEIYNKKSDIEDNMEFKRFKILSPDDILDASINKSE